MREGVSEGGLGRREEGESERKGRSEGGRV